MRNMMIQVSDGGEQWWIGPFEESQVDGVIADYLTLGCDILDIDRKAE